MAAHATTKPARVDYVRVPRPVWRKIKRRLPKPAPRRGRGRPPADTRAVRNGIWYGLWTGCQWKAVHRDWFGVARSVLHARLQPWQRQGRFATSMQGVVRFYARTRRVQWQWQAIDSRSGAAPLGGAATGNNPTDRAKCGTTLHLLVDARGAPLTVGRQQVLLRRHGALRTGDVDLGARHRRGDEQQSVCRSVAFDS